MTQKLPDAALAAIEQAKRTAGWNLRCRDVQRFVLPNKYGHAPCLLYVVPARRWATRGMSNGRASALARDGTA